MLYLCQITLSGRDVVCHSLSNMTAIEESMGIGWHATQEPEYQYNEYTAQKMQTTIIHIDILVEAICNHLCSPRGDEEEANGNCPCCNQWPVRE